MEFSAQAQQKLIYTAGISARKPLIPTDFTGLEAAAQKCLSKQAFGYLSGGAGLESTMHSNATIWDHHLIVPRMLQNVAIRNTSTQFFNTTNRVPFFLCPIGVLELACPNADLAVARACADTGVPMMVSSQASYPMEQIAKELKETPWYFQLYVSKSDELVRSFVLRAEQAGASGIVITLDTTLLGWRHRDLNQGFLPFIQGKGIAQYTSDPVFQKLAESSVHEPTPRDINVHSIRHLINMSRKLPGSFLDNLKGNALKSVRTFTQIYSRPDLNWEVIDQIKTYTRLPIILKGIQHTEDARLALNHNIDAIYISNHGGRQVDGAIASLDALVHIKKEIGDSLPILFDSGVRSGAHIMKAKALGATMVGIGRPYTYALALKGAQGVYELIKNMAADLELNMALAGINNVNDLDSDILQHIS